MKPAPTLIDTLYRATFRNEPIMGFKSNAELRERLINAHRFMLDERMSDFLGELATRAFVALKGDASDSDEVAAVKDARRNQQVEAMRVSAMAPHKITWIEYHLRHAAARTQALIGRPYNPAEAPEREGWLIEQHPELTCAYRMTLFSWNPKPEEQDDQGFGMWAFPVAFTWTIDDTPSPWPSLFAKGGTPDSGIASGIIEYDTPTVSIAQSELQIDVKRYSADAVKNLIGEWVGIVRRAWALLATLNDLPLVISNVRATKGFVAKGRYRRFLDHRTITISVPQKEQTKIARQVIALVRRRGHHVREHWRDDWRNPPSKRCPQFLATGLHAWTADQRCEICGGHRIRVHEHERGDSSLGYVTHDYRVEHEEPKT